MITVVRAGPGQYLESQTQFRSLLWVIWTQVLEIARVCINKKIGLEAELGLEPRHTITKLNVPSNILIVPLATSMVVILLILKKHQVTSKREERKESHAKPCSYSQQVSSRHIEQMRLGVLIPMS